MYPGADTTRTDVDPPIRRVYFNGWLGEYPFQPLNPNSATLQSSVKGAEDRFWAALGVWKDCDRDGFVGHGDQGLFEYRVELLPDTSVCRAQPIPTSAQGRPPLHWFPAHNDGTWVHELLPIAWTQADSESLGDRNPFNVNDNASRVWADFGLPEADLAPAAGPCEVAPPAGTLRSTGGLVRWGDCHLAFLATDAWNERAPDGTPAGQLSFRDAPRDHGRSASRLNQPNPWGRESDAALVEPWDCRSGGQLQSVRVDQETFVNVSRPRAPPGLNAGGSAAGTANSTASGFDECDRTSTQNHNRNVAGQSSHWGQWAARAPYAAESDTAAAAQGKTRPITVLAPSETARPASPWSMLLGDGAPPDLGQRIAGDAGVGLTGVTASDGFWTGNPNHAARGLPGAAIAIDRSTATPALRANATPVEFYTYYASVSDAAITRYGLSLAKGGAKAVYGSGACAFIGPGAGVQRGWQCDPAGWFRNAQGEDVEPRSPFLGPGDGAARGERIGARVGASYTLRDIDCVDWSVGAARLAGVHYGALSGTRCR